MGGAAVPGRHGSEPSPTGPHSEEPDASTNMVPPPRGRYCTSCGAAAATDDHFCTVCGAPLLKAEPPPASEPPATTPPAVPGGGEAVESDAAGPDGPDPDGPARSSVAEGYQGADGPAATRASVGPRADSRGRRGRLSRNAIVGILTVVVLILSGTVAALTLTGTSASTAVALEPLATPGANPFMPPVGTDQPGISPPQGSGGTSSGGTPGLYGGTLRQGSCDPRQMVAFLSAHPDKSAAWATVLGIRPADIAGYVASLAPVVLRSDVAVTNHGFTGGHVTSFPAVLQAGTAVLVDRYGSPVTKCFCGNPLTKPTAYSRPTYTGARWPSFAPGGITIIQQTTVTIDSFTLVDRATGASFRRPSGSTGSADQPGAAPSPKPATITTVAGNGTAGFCGDGGPATQACLYGPGGLALDAAGNLYIADRDNNRVRRVAPDGTITTVAGNGTAGFCGDGGPATQACLVAPIGLAVDAAGNLYITDYNNNRVRRMAPDGTITTVAGNGTKGFCGDGGPATQACLNGPGGLAVDVAGNLYVADHNNSRVRRVAPDGTVTTVAGNGTAGFCGDGGPATQACLNYPNGLFVDAAGNLYVADYNNRVRLVATPGGQPSPTTSTTPTPEAGGSPTRTSSPTPAQQVAVPATQPWTDTGIYLSEASVSFTASGTVNIFAGRADSNKTPDGVGSVHPDCIASPTTFGGQWIAMGLPCWSLIGRIGSGPPFEAGVKATHAVPSPGELYLGVNDESLGSFADNSGEWTVQVSRFP